MPDSSAHDHNVAGGSFPTPTSNINRIFYDPVMTEQPDDPQAARGALAGPPQIPAAQNPVGIPQLPKRSAARPRDASKPEPEDPAPNVQNGGGGAAGDDADEGDTDDGADERPVPPPTVARFTMRIGKNGQNNTSLERLNFPDAAHLVGSKVCLRLDPAFAHASLEQFRNSSWIYKAYQRVHGHKDKVFINWKHMAEELELEVGDTVSVTQAALAVDGVTTFNVVVKKGNGPPELPANNGGGSGPSDQKKKRPAAAGVAAAGTAAAAADGERGGVQKKRKSAPPAIRPETAAQPPVRQPSAPPAAPRPGGAACPARLHDLGACLEIMARRNVDFEVQAPFQLPFLRADPAVAAQALRVLTVADKGSDEDGLVQQTVETLQQHMK